MSEEIATYRVTHNGGTWVIEHDGAAEGDYLTKEAAFEAAIWAATNSIRDGIGIRIDVPPRQEGESSLGF